MAAARVRAEVGIEGMSCDHCVRAVTAALATVPGLEVKSVQVGRAEINGPGSHAVERAIEAISDAGFRARVTAIGTAPGPSTGPGCGGGGCGCGKR